MAHPKLQKAYERSRVPLYLQIAGLMRQRLETGVWPPGEKIPTLEELEAEFGVARVTVRQAVEVLRDQGLLHPHQGRGTFVAEKLQDRRWLKLATDWHTLAELLKENIPKQITPEGLALNPILSSKDGKLADEYVFLRSVQLKENEPYGVVGLQLAREVYERDPNRFKSSPALPVIAELVNVKSARQTITVSNADPEIADLLQVALGDSIVHCRCIISDSNDVIIYGAEISYRRECVEIEIDLLAKDAAIPKRVRDQRVPRLRKRP